MSELEGVEAVDLAESYGLPDFTPDYWKEAIGGTWRPLSGLGRHSGSHPLTVRRVLEEASKDCPEAADVIVALVHNASVASEAWRALSEQVNELQVASGELMEENTRLRRVIEGFARSFAEALAEGLEERLEEDEAGAGSIGDIVERRLAPAGRLATSLVASEFQDPEEPRS